MRQTIYNLSKDLIMLKEQSYLLKELFDGLKIKKTLTQIQDLISKENGFKDRQSALKSKRKLKPLLLKDEVKKEEFAKYGFSPINYFKVNFKFKYNYIGVININSTERGEYIALLWFYEIIRN